MERFQQQSPASYDYGPPRRLHRKASTTGNDLGANSDDYEDDVRSIKRLPSEGSGLEFANKKGNVIMEEDESPDESGSVGIANDNQQEESEDEGEDEYDEEMSPKQKKALYDAVVRGNIRLADELLMDVLSDINMAWYGDNLLMSSIRAGQSEMAEFLIDNGVDYNFASHHLDVRDPYTGDVDDYTISCRQMAYEMGLVDIVELIDYLNGHWWPCVKRSPRQVRLKTIVIPDEEQEGDEREDKLHAEDTDDNANKSGRENRGTSPADDRCSSTAYDRISISSAGYQATTSGRGSLQDSVRTSVLSSLPEAPIPTVVKSTVTPYPHMYKGTKSSLGREKVAQLKLEQFNLENIQANSLYDSRESLTDGAPSTKTRQPKHDMPSRPLTASIFEDVLAHTRNMTEKSPRCRTSQGSSRDKRQRYHPASRPSTAPSFLPLIPEMEQYDVAGMTNSMAYRNTQLQQLQDFNLIANKLFGKAVTEGSVPEGGSDSLSNQAYDLSSRSGNMDTVDYSILDLSGKSIASMTSKHPGSMSERSPPYKTHMERLASPAGYLRAY